MAKLLYVGTFATDDPTRATMPFIAASGALDRGHEPMIVMLGGIQLIAKARRKTWLQKNLGTKEPCLHNKCL